MKLTWIVGALAGGLLSGSTLLGTAVLGAAPPQEKGTTVPASDGSILDALPAETVLFVRVRHAEQFAKALRSSPLWKATSQPDFAPFVEELRKGWNELRTAALQETGTDLAELLQGVKGELSIAVGGISDLGQAFARSLATMEEPAITQEMLPLLLSINTLDESESFGANLEKLFSFARKNGLEIEEKSRNGGKITSAHRPADVGSGPEHIYFGKHGSRYFLSLSKKFLADTFAALEGKEGEAERRPLTDVKAFRTTFQHSGKGEDVFVYVNLEQIITAADKALGQSMFAFFWQKFKNLVIGSGLTNFGSGGSFREDGIFGRSFLHNKGVFDGALGWFHTEPFRAQPSPWVPTDVLTFSTFGVNIDRIVNVVKEVAQMAAAFSGQPVDIDGMFEQMFQMKLDEILHSLGNKVEIFQRKLDPTNPLGDTTVVLELDKAAPVKLLVQKVAAMSQGALAAETLRGREVHVAELPFGTAAGLTVTDGLLILSMSKANVEGILRRLDEKPEHSLASSESFQKLGEDLPREVAYLSYSSPAYLKAMFENLNQVMSASGEEVPAGVRRFLSMAGTAFGPSVGYGVWKDNGFYSEGRLTYGK